jgi:cellobiose transport system permease protein
MSLTLPAIDSLKGDSKLKGKRIAPGKKVSPFTYVILSLAAFLSAFPFYWMYVVASNESDEIGKTPPSIIPGPRFMEVVSNVYSVIDFNTALLNTAKVAVIVAVAQVFFSSIAGFAFSKLHFRGRKFLILFVVGTMMLPSQLGIIPLFQLMANLDWIDSLKALIIPALVTAFGVFWMRQIIDTQVPNELLEAASIDGASVLRIYWNVVLPIVRPSAFVLGLFSFLASWNDYLWPLLVLYSPENFTAQVAINALRGSYALDYSLNLGGALMTTAPLLLLFLFVGRRLVDGVMDGAVKG